VVSLLKEILELVGLIGGALTVLVGLYKCIRTLEEMKKSGQERKEENKLLIHGVLAALDGLQQLGANGNVTKAKENLKNFIIDN
jgi:hypothetical protein